MSKEIHLPQKSSYDTRNVYCVECDNVKVKQHKQPKKAKPAHPNAPISKTSHERLVETVKMQRIENKELKRKFEKEKAKEALVLIRS